MIEENDYINQIVDKISSVKDEELKRLINKLIEERNYLVDSINIDPLTGAYNRRILDHIREYSVIAMVDIDKFKSINDAYGHELGDEVLRKVSRSLMDHTRVSDFVIRYGGDEFLVIFVNCSVDVVKRRINEVQKELESEDNIPCNISLSIGISKYKDNNNIHNIIKEADNALYKSKNNKRTRITVYRS